MTLGSAFTHDQQTPIDRTAPASAGPPPVLVLSHHAWTEMFGSDPQIVGKTIRFAEINATVVGVASRDLDVPHGADFWVNARLQSAGRRPRTERDSARQAGHDAARGCAASWPSS